jgi:Synergist-CTERM protein sorting domain-containing protein
MLRRLAALACLAAAPALASGQTIIITESNDNDRIIGAGECRNSPVDQLAFAWTPSTPAAAYDLYASDTANCPAPGQTVNGVTNTAHTQSFATNIAQTSLNNGKTASDLLSLANIQCTSSSGALFICVFPTGNNTTPVATASITLDLASAPAPVLNSVSVGDSSLQANWQLGSGSADGGTTGSADRFNIYYAPTSNPANEQHTTITGGGLSGRVTGLTNGVEYTITVTALTIGGNESARSNPLTGTPHLVNDFWRLYRDVDAGREQGGCATGAAGLTALVALIPLALRRKRRRS